MVRRKKRVEDIEDVEDDYFDGEHSEEPIEHYQTNKQNKEAKKVKEVSKEELLKMKENIEFQIARIENQQMQHNFLVTAPKRIEQLESKQKEMYDILSKHNELIKTLFTEDK